MSISNKFCVCAAGILIVCVVALSPKAAEQAAKSWEEIFAERQRWWSLQPLQTVVIPEVQDSSWSAHPIDRFILARLEAAGLQPAPPADKHTLIRRTAFVLTGLPTTMEDACGFVESQSPDAYARLVDQLLASPHFGERWARHWMDVVRFSETHGNEWNYEVHHAWRYRDYLIRAFNQDLPYDQFIREHIAGDLIDRPRWNHDEQFNESVIGTAFYRFGEVNHDDCIGLPQIGFDLVDNQIDTLTKAFQATTVACARCHDHKLDAISMNDYHALLGILRSSRQVSHSLDAPNVNESKIHELTMLKRKIRSEMGGLWVQDTSDIDEYMLAAQAKITDTISSTEHDPETSDSETKLDPARLQRWIETLKPQASELQDPYSLWRALHPTNQTEAADFRTLWNRTASMYAEQTTERSEFNRTNFTMYADFRYGNVAEWQVAGQGLQTASARPGEFTMHTKGDGAIEAVLPAGVYTHLASQKLNGTLRSPLLSKGIGRISFHVIGQRSSALRLVSNNCQLNYKNYRALTNTAFQWITFSPPDDAEYLRVYAELMTMFDNPKFPDQLSNLGGDNANYKIPWEKAASDPRSYFGITRAVLHSADGPPKPDLTHFEPLWTGGELKSDGDVANRYKQRIHAAVTRWKSDEATEDDVVWLDHLLKCGLLRNQRNDSRALETLVTAYRNVERTLKLPRVAPGIADCGPGFDQPLLLRGDCMKPAEPVPRGYLKVLDREQEAHNIEHPTSNIQHPIANSQESASNIERPTSKNQEPRTKNQEPRTKLQGSGRLALAERIVDPKNPLTARVMVNRVWQHLFGEGLVQTVDDFGHAGEMPSHPELLDHLAEQFIREGWSIKRLVRTIVSSKTFQTSARPSEAAREVDPLNRLLQHYPARRMEAEAIRDSILAVSGRFDSSMYGLSIQPYRETENADRRLFAGPLDGHGRRSVYIKINLMESPKFLSAFNIPGGKVCQGRRDTANVPAQSLALLNDPFVLQQAERWARQLLARDNDSLESRITHIFGAAFGRAPDDEERIRFVAATEGLASLRGLQNDEALTSVDLWKDIAHAMFNLKEFIFIP